MEPIHSDIGVPLTPGGVYLSDMIARASEFGVQPNMMSPDSYDEDDSEAYEVDPNFDIRTDRFSLAEAHAREHARQAAAMINEDSRAAVGASASSQSLPQVDQGSPNGDPTPPATAPTTE